MLSRSLILFFSVFLVTDLGHSADLSTGGPEDLGPKQGWWWYEREPEKKEEKKEPEKAPNPAPSLSDHTTEELWNMHPDEFQALLMSLQKKAVRSPTIENVKEYYTIQDIARRKALAFANVAALVVQKYPELSLEGDFPNALPGKAAKVRQQAAEISQKIEQSKEDFALLYFFSPTCHFCAEQNDILRFFLEKYRGWQIRKIDISRNADLAEEFKVRAVPFLMLIHKNSKDFMPVSIGVVALTDMEERLYRGIRVLGKEITPEEFSMYEFQRGGGFDPAETLRVKERTP